MRENFNSKNFNRAILESSHFFVMKKNIYPVESKHYKLFNNLIFPFLKV